MVGLMGMMLSEVIHTDRRQIPYDFTYMWNLINKTNEQTKQNRNRLIDKENKLMVGSDKGGRRLVKIGNGN